MGDATEHIERHDNGKIRTRATLVDGELEGECVTYDEEERVISRSHHVKGKLDGETIRYGEGGREIEKSTFKDGVLEGEMVTHDDAGQVPSAPASSPARCTGR